MIMVDQNKAVLIGELNTVVTEIAFLMDKLCGDSNNNSIKTYDEVQDIILERVVVFREERDSGYTRNHPHEDITDGKAKAEEQSAAEEALQEAMKEIKAMKAERIKKAEEALKPKKEKTKKKKSKSKKKD